MVWKLIFTLCFIWSLLWGNGVTGHHCTNEQLAICEADSLNYLYSSGYNQTGISTIRMTDEQVRTVCNLFINSTKSCYLNLNSHCNLYTQATLFGFIDAREYLCEEAMEDFITTKPCLQDETVNSDMYLCTYQYSIKTAHCQNNTLGLAEDKKQECCSAMEEVADCEADTAKIHCGDTAGRFIRTYNTRRYHHMIDELCPVSDSSTSVSPPPTTDSNKTTDSNVMILIIIVAAVFGAVIVLVVLGCVCYRKCSNKSTNKQDAKLQRLEGLSRQVSNESELRYTMDPTLAMQQQVPSIASHGSSSYCECMTSRCSCHRYTHAPTRNQKSIGHHNHMTESCTCTSSHSASCNLDPSRRIENHRLQNVAPNNNGKKEKKKLPRINAQDIHDYENSIFTVSNKNINPRPNIDKGVYLTSKDVSGEYLTPSSIHRRDSFVSNCDSQGYQLLPEYKKI